MIANIHFNNKFAKQTSLLYLFYRLRMYCQDRGGYIRGFVFSHNEKYNLLPKLIEMGWVVDGRVKKYRTLCRENGCCSDVVAIKEEDLKSLKAFKGFLVGACESQYVRSRYKELKGTDKSRRTKVFNRRDKTFEHYRAPEGAGSNPDYKKISKEGIYYGQVVNSTIGGLMGISETTVTNGRKESKNMYNLQTFYLSCPETKGRGEDKFFYAPSKKDFVTYTMKVWTHYKVLPNRFSYPKKGVSKLVEGTSNAKAVLVP